MLVRDEGLGCRYKIALRERHAGRLDDAGRDNANFSICTEIPYCYIFACIHGVYSLENPLMSLITGTIVLYILYFVVFNHTVPTS